MTAESSSGAPDDLNFDRAESASGADGAAPNQCANCGKALSASYHTANGAPICSSCRGKLQSAVAPVRSPALLFKALAFGFAAAIVGAIIYYAVMRFLNLEIGLVAILTGWMVGKAMHTATAGRGGRLMQVSAGLLVYVSVAMAYFPFAVQQIREEIAAAPLELGVDVPEIERLVDSARVAALVDSMAAVAAADPNRDAAMTEVALTDADRRALREENAPDVNPLLGLIIVAGFAFALPLLAIVGSMPGGLISAAIIGFGIVQAWQLTGAPQIHFEGPFKLAGNDPPPDDRDAPSR
jgi:hypothetical protein